MFVINLFYKPNGLSYLVIFDKIACVSDCILVLWYILRWYVDTVVHLHYGMVGAKCSANVPFQM